MLTHNPSTKPQEGSISPALYSRHIIVIDLAKFKFIPAHIFIVIKTLYTVLSLNINTIGILIVLAGPDDSSYNNRSLQLPTSIISVYLQHRLYAIPFPDPRFPIHFKHKLVTSSILVGLP